MVMKQMVLVLTTALLMQNCVEPFEFETTQFTSALVVEGTITDREETQRILVSRTFPLDTVLMSGVSNAKVLVEDTNGGTYDFTEEEAGVYRSNVPFAAVSGRLYTLSIETPDGKTYTSEETPVPARTTIERLYAERGVKDSGTEEGMYIYVDSFDPTGESKYYRYEYEETYKIVAPFWSPADAYVISPLPEAEVGTRARTQEERVCYNTVASNAIIQENTTEFNEDRVSKFPVRFIDRNNYILSHRYSILVKQYVQNSAAFEYYRTLETLSGSESLFTQIQAGFLEGNIKSSTADENVVGFFQVATVSEQRLFFDYADFFPGERLPDYVRDCPLLSPPLFSGGPPPTSPLIDGIQFNLIKYYSDYVATEGGLLTSDGPGPFFMVYTVCGDCTVLGSNVIPEFWEED